MEPAHVDNWRKTLCRIGGDRLEHKRNGIVDLSYDGRAIANYVLDRCDEGGRSLTHIPLQKVVYFCHVWSLIELKRPLVKHQFEAWPFGPVLQYLYREFKAFESAPIRKRASQLDPRDGHWAPVGYAFDPDTSALLAKTVDFYSRLSAADLVELSHVRGGPWDRVWNHTGTVNPGMKIPDWEIAEFYSRVRRPFAIQ